MPKIQARSDKLIKIGDVARRTGMSLRTIRYYESLRLIQPEAKTPGGQRLYAERQCQRLGMIRDLRTLDVPLRDIRALLTQRKNAQTGAEAVRGVARVFGKGVVGAPRRQRGGEGGVARLGRCAEAPAQDRPGGWGGNHRGRESQGLRLRLGHPPHLLPPRP